MLAKYSRNFNRKCLYIFFGATFLMFWFFYIQTPPKPNVAAILSRLEYNVNIDIKHQVRSLNLQYYNGSENVEFQYLVNSSKCRIHNLNPYNPEILPYYKPKSYIKCTKKKLLTYVNKTNNIATIYIDEDLLKKYYPKKNVRCCYKTIYRSKNLNVNDPDAHIDVGSCISFERQVVMESDFVLVLCTILRKEIYKNIHAVVTIKEDIRKKMEHNENKKKEHLSVLFVGIDSISRMNLVRSLPLTHTFLQQNDWVEFKGYNKIGDNTFPNLIAILTGLNESTAFALCNPRIVGQLDNCDMVWYNYRKLGFITGYGEDEAEIGTFNYLKKGFRHEPTDYYFRPYILATEQELRPLEIDVVKYCTGPETSGERIFNLARDFTSTFKDYLNFGFFWMNSYSHNELNSVSRMDQKILDFLVDLNSTEILKNSLVIFISDHGFRFGTITYTHAGWLEERLPFFYMSVPKWFQKKHPRKYENLLKNTEKLTSPYDLYMTLQEVLVLSGKKYTIKKSDGCPKCKSLFHEIETERSCKDAGIEHHWCTCGNYLTISTTSPIASEAAKFIVFQVHRAQIITGTEFTSCSNFEVKKVISAGISDTNNTILNSLTYFLITFETIPKAVFQGTVSVNMSSPMPNFNLEGSISRLDIYKENSWCVNDSVLKKYCYCKMGLNWFWNLVYRIFNFFHIS